MGQADGEMCVHTLSPHTRQALRVTAGAHGHLCSGIWDRARHRADAQWILLSERMRIFGCSELWVVTNHRKMCTCPPKKTLLFVL